MSKTTFPVTLGEFFADKHYRQHKRAYYQQITEVGFDPEYNELHRLWGERISAELAEEQARGGDR